MKTNIIKVLFGLILTFSISVLYAQSPRIKLNQIVKDTISGSVLISNLADSNMVYSRNFYINAADTSLVFFGTTIVAGSGGGGSFVTLPQLTDSLALYATKVQLSDSMATVLKQVATDLTLTGDGSVGNPLKVDTTTYIATKGDLNLKQDQLNGTGFVKATGTTISYDNSTYLTGNQTITLSGDVTGSGTTAITATVVDDSHNHVISNVDNLQDSLNSRMVTDFSNASGTLPVANGGTGATSFTTGRVLFGNGTSAINTDGNLFWDNSTKRLGIGTTTPAENLQVKGNLLIGGSDFANNAILTLQTNGSSNLPLILYKNDNASSTAAVYHTAILTRDEVGDEDAFAYTIYKSNFTNLVNRGFTWNNYTTPIMRLTAAGNLGIGTTSPAYELHVVDDIFASDSVICTTLSQTSDVRLKKDINEINNSLNKIINLNPVSYNYLTDSNSVNKRFGFIAQEVEAFLPNLVSERFDGMKILNYSDIIPLNTKAIQEQQSIIESIQTELDAKSSIIESQAFEIEQLKNQIQLILTEIEQIKNN